MTEKPTQPNDDLLKSLSELESLAVQARQIAERVQEIESKLYEIQKNIYEQAVKPQKGN